MDSTELINQLNALLKTKHASIIQYLLHAYSLGEGEIPSEIEEVSREEMRHFKWLAQFVVKHGGDPTMERGPVTSIQTDRSAMLLLDRDRARESMEDYQRLMAISGDDRLNQLLERLIQDEMFHVGFFEKMAGRVGEIEVLPMSGSSEIPPKAQAIIDMLNADLQDEYEAILKYLHQSFVTTDKEAADVLEDVAIEEMRHLGHLSEEVMEMGGLPLIEAEPNKLLHDLEQMLRSDIRDEEVAGSNYQLHIDAIDDPKIQALLRRIMIEEDYHEVLFKDILDRITKAPEAPAEPSGNKLTVGSLFRQA